MSLDLLVCFDWILLSEYKRIIYIQYTLKSIQYGMYNISDSISTFIYILSQGMTPPLKIPDKSWLCLQLMLFVKHSIFQWFMFSLHVASSSASELIFCTFATYLDFTSLHADCLEVLLYHTKKMLNTHFGDGSCSLKIM